MISKSFNLHGIVRLQVETCSPTLIQQVMYQLSEFETTLEDDHSPDILIRDYAEAPHLSEPGTISEYYYYADDWLNIAPHRTWR